MTPKRSRFVQEYLIDLNAAEAARRAGYSRRTARAIGSHLLTKVEVCRALDAAMAERNQRTSASVDRVMTELGRIAFFDVAEVFDADGRPRQLDDMSPEARAAIAGVEVIEQVDADGRPTGRVRRLKIADKLAALKKLGEHLGMFEGRGGEAKGEDALSMLIREMQDAAQSR